MFRVPLLIVLVLLSSAWPAADRPAHAAEVTFNEPARQAAGPGGAIHPADFRVVEQIAFAADATAFGAFASSDAMDEEGGAVVSGIPVLAGDYNFDGLVSVLDYVTWRDSRGTVGMFLPADGSGPTEGVPDGMVDQFDYAYWAANYGGPFGSGAGAGSPGAIGSSSAAVPEPAGRILAVFALIGQILFASPMGRGYNRRRMPQRDC